MANGGVFNNTGDFYAGTYTPTDVSGNVFVTDANSQLLISGNAYLGYNGQGNLTIANGGLVSVGGQLTLGLNYGDGELAINSNGTLEVGGSYGLYVGGGSGNVTMDGGIIEVINSDLYTPANITILDCLALPSIIDTNGFNATFAGIISDKGELEKTG